LIVAATLIAILDVPYGYYQLLRLIITAYAGYLAWSHFRSGASLWAWPLTFVGLLYNPIFPISMSKGFHGFVDVFTAGLLVAEMHRFRSQGPVSSHAGSDAGKTRHAVEHVRMASSESLPRYVLDTIIPIAAIIGAFLAFAALANLRPDTLGSTSDVSDSIAEAPLENELASQGVQGLPFPTDSFAQAATETAERAKAVAPSLPTFSQFPVEESIAVALLQLAPGSQVRITAPTSETRSGRNQTSAQTRSLQLGVAEAGAS
jgi:hypothetical protein